MTGDDAWQFAQNAETEARLRAGVIPSLVALLESLPDTPPDDAEDYTAYGVAHGFYCRIARTAQAALQLVDAGYGREAAPLRRALWEHALALTWVVDEGKAASDSLTRVHQNRMEWIKSLVVGKSNLTADLFDPLLTFEVDSHGQDHLAQFGQLVQRYQFGDDLLTPWLVDTGSSHPSFSTARDYWHDDATRLATVPETDVTISNDVCAIFVPWWIGSCAMDRLTGWGDELASIGKVVGLPIMLIEKKKTPEARQAPGDMESFAREHVCYEAEMLVATAARLRDLPEGTVDHDAVLESFLVHARLLDDFLACPIPEQKGRGNDDVVARYYVPTWPLKRVIPGSQRVQANKLVAHLTWSREDKQPIDVALILGSVVSGLRRFLSEVPSERRPWFERAQQALAGQGGATATTTTTTTTN